MTYEEMCIALEENPARTGFTAIRDREFGHLNGYSVLVYSYQLVDGKQELTVLNSLDYVSETGNKLVFVPRLASKPKKVAGCELAQFVIVMTVGREKFIQGSYTTLERAREALILDARESADIEYSRRELRDIMQHSEQELGDFGGTPNTLYMCNGKDRSWGIFAMFPFGDETLFQKLL